MVTKRRRKKNNVDLYDESKIEEEATVKDGYRAHFQKPRVSGRNASQKSYIKAINDNHVVVCNGPAGTGKTHVAVGMALDHLYKNNVKRIVIARPAVESGENLGFLPGDLEAKMAPYLRPIFDELAYYVGSDTIAQMESERVLEICPMAYMRGRTFKDCFIICDECQNATEGQIPMLFTRLGEGSKLIMTGDISQSDLHKNDKGAFKRLYERFDNEHLRSHGIACHKFEKRHIVRHPITEVMIEAYGEN